MDRRHFLKTLPVFTALPIGISALNARANGFPYRQSRAENTALQLLAGPYLQYLDETSMAFVWITNVDCTAHLEYGQGDQLTTSVYSTRHGFIDAYTHIHTARITDLIPGTPYQYRIHVTENKGEQNGQIVLGETLTSDVFPFQLPERNQREFNFMVFNDVHGKHPLIQSLSAMVPQEESALVFLNGDIVNSVNSERQMCTEVFQPYSKYFAGSIPMVYVRGNHETREKLARQLCKYIVTNNGKFYYCFRYGSVHFTVLDSGNHIFDANSNSFGLCKFTPYRQEQAQWMAEVIQTPAYQNAKYRIVLFHIPLGRSEVGSELIAHWREVLNSGRIDLVICGHVHEYKRIDPGSTYKFTTLIGGGPDEEVGSEATAITVRVSDEKLHITVRRSDSSLVEDFSILSQ